MKIELEIKRGRDGQDYGLIRSNSSRNRIRSVRGTGDVRTVALTVGRGGSIMEIKPTKRMFVTGKLPASASNGKPAGYLWYGKNVSHIPGNHWPSFAITITKAIANNSPH